MFVFERAELNVDGVKIGDGGETTLNIATATKALYGQYNFPGGIIVSAKKMTGTMTGVTFSEGHALAGGQVFQATLFANDPSTGKQFSVLLYHCSASQVAANLDFQCFANANGQICQFNFGDEA